MEIRIKLLSDTTFGRGDGVSGLVDQEIEHDPLTGLPIVRGRTLKGLLVEACADLFYALGHSGAMPSHLTRAAHFLFGTPGSDLNSAAKVHVGTARLPDLLRKAVQADVDARRLTTADVLDALTEVRRQTSVDETTDMPAKGSLRSIRVLLRGTELIAPVTFPPASKSRTDLHARQLLAACVASVQRGGLSRNRGKGRLELSLWENGTDKTGVLLAQFLQGATST